MRKKKGKEKWDEFFDLIMWSVLLFFISGVMGIGGYYLSSFSGHQNILSVMIAGFCGSLGGMLWAGLLKLSKQKEETK